MARSKFQNQQDVLAGEDVAVGTAADPKKPTATGKFIIQIGRFFFHFEFCRAHKLVSRKTLPLYILGALATKAMQALATNAMETIQTLASNAIKTQLNIWVFIWDAICACLKLEFVTIALLIVIFIRMESKFGRMEQKFDEKFVRMEQKFDEKFVRMENNLEQMTLSNVRATAKRATVHVSDIKGNGGSGFIILLNDSFYLVTAAHVLVVLEVNFTVKEGNSRRKLKATTTKIYLSKRYVSLGYADIGIAQIELDNAATLKTKTIGIAKGDLVGKVAGFGLDGLLMPGHVVEVNGHKRGRVFGSFSKPGCSGSPIFDNNGNLYAIVHGPSKHRGLCHSGDKHIYVSSEYFADLLSPGLKFDMIIPNKDSADGELDGPLQLLRLAEEAAEEIPEEEHADRNFWRDYENKANIKLLGQKMGMPEEFSLDEAFTKLTKEVFCDVKGDDAKGDDAKGEAFEFPANLDFVMLDS